MLPEMPLQFARWGDPNNIAAQMAAFTADHEMFRDQLLCRSTFVFNQLRQVFNLTKKVQVELDVFPPDAGSIQLNTIEPQNLPEALQSKIQKFTANELVLRLHREHDSISDILESLRCAQITFTDLRTEDAGLEEVFIQLTQKQEIIS